MKYPFVPYVSPDVPIDEVAKRARAFYKSMDSRRSVREFSDRPVPRAVIEDLVRTASTAPSGAHRQPWSFAAIRDPEMKKRIREAAEEEERISYGGRMPDEWITALLPLGTTWQKPFLEVAPWLVVVFRQDYGLGSDGERIRNYYVGESVGIAAGMFISAAHQAGLSTLTHTPSPMNFLGKILKRPPNERAFLLLPVGYPADGVEVPDIRRKGLDEVLEVWDGSEEDSRDGPSSGLGGLS